MTADLKEQLLNNPSFAVEYEKKSFEMHNMGVGSGNMADSNKDEVFGYDKAGYRKTNCKIPYDEDNTETHYVLGWQPAINNAIEKDNEDKERKAKGQPPIESSAFRFKQLNSEQHGYKIKMGEREHFIDARNSIDPKRCHERAFHMLGKGPL